MKARVPKPAQETAQIIAVTFTTDTIAYNVKLNNGTDVTLHGDKYVHDIDLIDTSKPPTLSILTSHTLSNLKRDVDVMYEEAMSPVRVELIPIAKRGGGCISTYTAAISEDTCHAIECLNNGGKPAMFNQFLKSCYCETPVLPESSPTNKAKWSEPDVSEDLPRKETAESLIRSVPWLTKPSSETCRHVIVCQGESQPYFDEAAKQCLCVVYRPGIKEPVITSDSNIFPRAEQDANPSSQSGDFTHNRKLWTKAPIHAP